MKIKIEKFVERLNYLFLIARSLKSSNFRSNILAVFLIGKPSESIDSRKQKYLTNFENECLHLPTERISPELLLVADNPLRGFLNLVVCTLIIIKMTYTAESLLNVKFRDVGLTLFLLLFNLILLHDNHINKFRLIEISGASTCSLEPLIE